MNLAALIKRKQLQFESRMLLIGVTRELCKVTEVQANRWCRTDEALFLLISCGTREQIALETALSRRHCGNGLS